MFAQPLGLLALLAVPAVVALHLFRRRFRRHPVSALFLWDDRDTSSAAGRRRERLRTNASFWLEVAAAALLGLLLGGPRFLAAGEATHLVVVLDASASMGARGPEGPLDARARREVAARIDALASRSRVTLVQSGPQPRVLAGPAAFPAEARAALDDYRPRATAHALLPSLALALQLSGGGQVLLVTDHFAPEEIPAEVELLSLGTSLDNVALTRAQRGRGRDGDGNRVDRVLLTVEAFSTAPLRRELTLEAEGGVLARRTLELAPGGREHLRFVVPEDAGPVVARLAPDALELDDEAWLAPPPPRTLAVASTLSEADARRLGLAGGADEGPLARLLAFLPDALESPTVEGAHLVLAPGIAGGPASWVLSFVGLSGGAPATTEEHVRPFLVERRHPLLEGTTFEGVVWSRDPSIDLQDRPLVSAGRTALFTERVEPRRRIYRLNLLPATSSLQRSPDWPILLANLAEARRLELPGPVRANVVLGEPYEYRGRSAGKWLARPVRAPGAAAFEVAGREHVVVDGLGVPGLWALDLDGREVARFGVHFEDARESDLRGQGPGRRAAEGEAARLQAAMGLGETLLAAAVLACLLADWWVLRPRRAGEVAT